MTRRRSARRLPARRPRGSARTAPRTATPAWSSTTSRRRRTPALRRSSSRPSSGSMRRSWTHRRRHRQAARLPPCSSPSGSTGRRHTLSTRTRPAPAAAMASRRSGSPARTSSATTARRASSPRITPPASTLAGARVASRDGSDRGFLICRVSVKTCVMSCYGGIVRAWNSSCNKAPSVAKASRREQEL